MKKQLTIVKLGGKLLDDDHLLSTSLQAFAQLGCDKILVHGGGKSATQIAEKLGINAPMVAGRRITSREMLDIAIMVYGGLLNKSLVAKLQALQVDALGMTGADLSIIKAHKRPISTIDYGFAGDIDEIGIQPLTLLLEAGVSPVLAPLTHDSKGQLLNTNADTIAGEIACAMAALYEVHLVFCFDRVGVLEDAQDETSLISHITYERYLALKQQHIITDGMIPKLDNAFSAIQKGVVSVYLCHPHALSKLYTRDFCGTVLKG